MFFYELKEFPDVPCNGKIINFNMSQKEVKKIAGEEAPRIEIDNIMKEKMNIVQE